jgi:predicted nucleotidyltransferase component of viral defense system
MNKDFYQIINASIDDRRGLFLLTANRLGTTLQNVEKDFWVCWMLDLIFNGRDPSEPRLLFKGGTSLSKAYSLISRFSEDVDITVFREDLGLNIEVENLELLSGKQQRKQLELIRQSCQEYIQGSFRKYLLDKLQTAFLNIGSFNESCIVADEHDPQQQTLLIYYPSVIKTEEDYVKPMIKIEAGAKSALDPHQLMVIQPYVAEELPTINLCVPNVMTIEAERTF